MATMFTTELDGTNGSALTANATDGGNSGFTVKTGTWTYTTATKASGTASATAATSADTAVLTRIHDNLVTTRYYDFCGRLSTLDGGSMMIAQILNGAENKANVFVTPTGAVALRNVNTVQDTTATTLVAGQFYRIQWGISGSSQTLRLWVSSTLANLFTTGPTETISGPYTGAAWDRVKFGCMSSKTLQVWVDRVIVDDSTFPTSGASGNVAPTANAGADQGVASGATVTLSGSGTDTDGTIASYAWTQVSGPVVTLSSTTAASPTFTAPTLSATTDLVFGLRVTDNGGSQSTQDTVTVTVAAGSGVAAPADDFYQLFNTGPAGATVTTANTNLDNVDSGVTFTSDAIGEGGFAATGAPAGGTLVMTHNLPAAASSQYVDAVFKLSTLGGGPWYVMRARSGTTVRASVRVNADGTVQMRNGTTASTTSTTATVTAGQPFRIAWHLNNGGSMELRLFTGGNLWGTTPDTGGTITYNQNTGTFDSVSVGNTLAATGTWVVDSFRVDASDWPAPLGTVAALTNISNLYVLNDAGAWVATTLDIIT